MNYLQLQNEIHNMMRVLNGWVNPTISCFKYTFEYKKSPICAGERDAIIHFYPIKILEKMELYPDKIIRANVLFIVTHELSHIEQLLNYDRYSADQTYRKEIERGCNYHAFRFIMDNLGILHQRLGDFDEFTLYNSCSYLKFNNIRYQLGTNWEMVSNLLHQFIQEKFLLTYRSYDHIEMYINNGHPTHQLGSGLIVIRDGNNIINVNKFFRIVHVIRSFSKIRLSNKEINGGLMIYLILPAEEYNLEAIVRRIGV